MHVGEADEKRFAKIRFSSLLRGRNGFTRHDYGGITSVRSKHWNALLTRSATQKFHTFSKSGLEAEASPWTDGLSLTPSMATPTSPGPALLDYVTHLGNFVHGEMGKLLQLRLVIVSWSEGLCFRQGGLDDLYLVHAILQTLFYRETAFVQFSYLLDCAQFNKDVLCIPTKMLPTCTPPCCGYLFSTHFPWLTKADKETSLSSQSEVGCVQRNRFFIGIKDHETL